MNKFVSLFLYTCLCIICATIVGNWGQTETTIEGDKKQQVNFYGSLLTHQAKEAIKVDNISIGGKYKQIPMIEKPALTQDMQQATMDSPGKIARKEVKLEVDPKTELVTTKIDLSEVSAIQIPNPQTIWSYQKQTGSRKIEFLEVIIVSNSQQKTEAHYLLEARTKIYCDEINDAGPIEKEVPLAAVNILAINGYKFRTLQTNETKTNKSDCSCESTPKNTPKQQ
jgi:hypothetical protein